MPKCTYKTEEDIASTSVVGFHLKLLGFLMDAFHPMAPTPVTNSTGKTYDPKPQLKDGFMWEEQWDFFTYSWQQYKSVANMDGSMRTGWVPVWGHARGTWWPPRFSPSSGISYTRSWQRWR